MTRDQIIGGRPAPSSRPAPVPLDPSRHRPGPTRTDDRKVTTGAIVVAGLFLLAAGLSLVAQGAGATVLSPWLPIHLALAGGASTAIAGVMPFFVSALAAGHPAPSRLRAGAVATVAFGAGLVALRGVLPALPGLPGPMGALGGMMASGPAAALLPPIGGSIYLVGIGLVAAAVRASGRSGLMMRRPIVTWGYQLAVLNVAVGATLATLMLAGFPPVLEHWDRLKPAHAWTNVIGFVSLVIVSTLLHFLPTVLGGLIVPRRSAIYAVLGIALGAPLAGTGLLFGLGPMAGGGAVLVAIGAGATGLEAVRVVRARGRWTTDLGWHRMASAGLLAGVAWFVIGCCMAAGLVVLGDASAGSWSTPLVIAPLAIGWIVQVIVASWTHLLPSVGPGGPVEHARQRVVLGRLATLRLVGLNTGTALVWAGLVPGGGPAPWVVPTGATLVTLAILASVVLAGQALRLVQGGRPAAPPLPATARGRSE